MNKNSDVIEELRFTVQTSNICLDRLRRIPCTCILGVGFRCGRCDCIVYMQSRIEEAEQSLKEIATKNNKIQRSVDVCLEDYGVRYRINEGIS